MESTIASSVFGLLIVFLIILFLIGAVYAVSFWIFLRKRKDWNEYTSNEIRVAKIEHEQYKQDLPRDRDIEAG